MIEDIIKAINEIHGYKVYNLDTKELTGGTQIHQLIVEERPYSNTSKPNTHDFTTILEAYRSISDTNKARELEVTYTVVEPNPNQLYLF